MTGSGAAVFGIFDDENAARKRCSRLEKRLQAGLSLQATHGGPRVTVRRLFGAKK